MKLTKSKLRQLIREELQQIHEASNDQDWKINFNYEPLGALYIDKYYYGDEYDAFYSGNIEKLFWYLTKGSGKDISGKKLKKITISRYSFDRTELNTFKKQAKKHNIQLKIE